MELRTSAETVLGTDRQVLHLRALSREVSRALRHAPCEYGIKIDEHGWAEISVLLDGLKRRDGRWEGVSPDHLQMMVGEARRRRHEIDGGRIRALYGHSYGAGVIEREFSAPPATLFHGTDLKAAARVLEQGLFKRGRQQVHLTSDREYAQSLALPRRAKRVVLMVHAAEASRWAVPFYQASDHVWLSDYVPARFIALEESRELLAEQARVDAVQHQLRAMEV